MNVLLEYVRNIGYFLILMSLVGNVMPDNSYKKYCRMFCGLILMVLVISPFYDFLNMEGDLSDVFVDASFKSQVAELKSQLMENDISMNERIIDEYEQLIIDECQGIAVDEGLYILDVSVDVIEEEDMELVGLNMVVTTDKDKYVATKEKEELDNIGNISVDKINVGEEENYIIDKDNVSNVDPMVISFINRVGEFLKIDTSIINVEVVDNE